MADKLPEYLRNEFYTAFKRFDKDGDNTISTDEIGDVLKNLGINFDEEKKHELINKVDIDNSGNIDFNEFCSLLAMKMRIADSDEEFFEVFKVFDRDMDGYINYLDIKEIFEYLNENIEENETKEMIQLASKNNKDYLDYSEFMEFIMKKNYNDKFIK